MKVYKNTFIQHSFGKLRKSTLCGNKSNYFIVIYVISLKEVYKHIYTFHTNTHKMFALHLIAYVTFIIFHAFKFIPTPKEDKLPSRLLTGNHILDIRITFVKRALTQMNKRFNFVFVKDSLH